MTIEQFERDYGRLPDSADATEVLGRVSIHKGVATVGDIRKACQGFPKDASIRPDLTCPAGFYITDIHSPFSQSGGI